MTKHKRFTNGLVLTCALVMFGGGNVWCQAVLADDSSTSSGATAATVTAMASDQSWHEDQTAGVKFPLPFKIGREKTTQQAHNLILAEAGVKLPANATVTSALYGERDVPFVLVWKIETKLAATLGDLAAMAAQVGELRGLNDWQFNQYRLRGTATATFPATGLGASMLVQLVEGGAVVVGYYYRDLADAALFQAIADGFELTSAKVLRPKPRTLSLLFQDKDIYIILLIAGAVTVSLLWFLGRRQRLP
ncbi:MAG: hypothetical protein FJ146_11970 [Deltaproteobacteria bacterium]|nr:hypothetical protein [Deltaproteobacteria bacterium]